MIHYQEIVRHLSDNKGNWKHLLFQFEEAIIAERDDREIKLPVYLTKWRIKNADSVYIKTKRKPDIKKLDQVYDYAGLRILCLFPQDIYPVHWFLINYIKKESFSIKEMNIFNYDPDDPSSIKMAKDAQALFSKAYITPDRKKSGYKSIHYVVECQLGTKNIYAIEIQLRTILQDAWSELEHSLSYKKGNIHPHIRKSFSLLARDLETNDLLIAHLREISQKESITEEMTIRESGPHKYFRYLKELIPEKFLESSCYSYYEPYHKYISTTSPAIIKENIKEARKLYKALKAKCTGDETDNTIFKYYLEMENAYLLFCENKYEDAVKIYNRLLETFNDRYVLYFRIGEIYFITGNVVKALENFDQSQLLLNNPKKDELENSYRIKVKLANIYWLLGQEYTNIALEHILDAQMIFEHCDDIFTERDIFAIKNNVCWYYLEKWIFEKEKLDALYINKPESEFKKKRESIKIFYDNLKDAYKKLEEVMHNDKMNKEEISSNDFDTVAWCCYHFYLEEKHPDYLARAKDYAIKMTNNKKNFCTFKRTSEDIHMSHYLTIITTK